MAPLARPRSVVLRSERDAAGTRHLEASLRDDGCLVIEGHDLGPGVSRVFGSDLTEYEWCWTISAGDVPRLRSALDPKGRASVLDLLAERFSGPAAAGLHRFLEGHDIPFAAWSRIGD